MCSPLKKDLFDKITPIHEIDNDLFIKLINDGEYLTAINLINNSNIKKSEKKTIIDRINYLKKTILKKQH